MALKDVGYRLVVEGWEQFQSRMTAANQAQAGFNDKLKAASPSLKRVGLAMTGIALGIGAGSIKLAADFDSAMRSVNTMLRLGEEEFQALSDSTLQVAKDVGKAPTEMARALYEVNSRGIPAANALDFLGVAAQTGVAGLVDTETAVIGLTNALNAYRMPVSEAGHVSDVMFQAAAIGGTTFAELAEAMSVAAPQAANLGVSFEELMGSIGTITKAGVPTAAAMTQVRASLTALQSPSTQMSDLLEQMGFSTARAALETLGYQGTLNGLRDAAAGNDAVLVDAFGRIEGYNALLNLTGQNAAGAAADLDIMAGASDGVGASMAAFEQMNMGANRQFEIMWANLQAVGIQLGTALLPAITSVVKIMEPFLTRMAGWIEANPKLTIGILAAVAAIGGLALFLGFLPGLIAGVQVILPLLGAAFSVALGPIGLVVLAVAALIAGLVWLIKNWDKVTSAVRNFFSARGEAAMDSIEEGPDMGSLAPGLASGGMVRRGGSVWVGERGPELVRLPAGAMVQPAGEVNYNITENYARPDQPQSLDMTLRALEMMVRS